MDKKIIIVLMFICMINCGYAGCHSSCGGSQVDGTDCVSG